MVSEVLVSTASISVHSPIFCIWSFKLPRRLSKGHSSIEYRPFKNFNVDIFLFDLSTMPFHGVFNYNDPSEALAFWYDAFLPVVNKHAPLRRKRVKHPKLPPWLTKDIIQAMVLRDKLKRDKLSDLYKKQRNKVSTLVRIAKKNYFNKLITDSRDTVTIWRAVNEITRKSRPHQLSPLQLKLTLEKTDIEQVHEHRVLGVTIDAEMKWQSQLSNVCKIVSKKLFLLSQLRY